MVPASGPETHGFLQKKKDVPGFPVPHFNQVWKSQNSTPEHRIWYPCLHQSCFFLCASTGLQTVSDSASIQLSIRNHDLYLGHQTGRLVASSLERTRPVTFMEEFWGHPVPNHRIIFSI